VEGGGKVGHQTRTAVAVPSDGVVGRRELRGALRAVVVAVATVPTSAALFEDAAGVVDGSAVLASTTRTAQGFFFRFVGKSSGGTTQFVGAIGSRRLVGRESR